jgi:hypothetical protein
MSHDVLFFIAVATAVAGQGLDVITTNAGISVDGVKSETNAVVRWAITKLGLPVVAFIKVGGLAIGLPVLFYSFGHPNVGSYVAFASAAAGFVTGVINYRRLKAAKISVF